MVGRPIRERVAPQVKHPERDARVWEHRLDRLSKSGQPLHTRDEAILHPPVVQVREDGEPEVSPRVFRHPHSSPLLLPLHRDAPSAKETALFLTGHGSHARSPRDHPHTRWDPGPLEDDAASDAPRRSPLASPWEREGGETSTPSPCSLLSFLVLVPWRALLWSSPLRPCLGEPRCSSISPGRQRWIIAMPQVLDDPVFAQEVLRGLGICEKLVESCWSYAHRFPPLSPFSPLPVRTRFHRSFYTLVR